MISYELIFGMQFWLQVNHMLFTKGWSNSAPGQSSGANWKEKQRYVGFCYIVSISTNLVSYMALCKSIIRSAGTFEYWINFCIFTLIFYFLFDVKLEKLDIRTFNGKINVLLIWITWTHFLEKWSPRTGYIYDLDSEVPWFTDII